MNIEGLDKLDNAILEVIKDNARMSYSDIGEKVGLSRVAVKNRMEALERKGIIQGYKTIIDETKMPDGILFTLDVEVIPSKYQDIVKVLTDDTLIKQIYGTTGACRVHCVGFAPNMSTLKNHVKHLKEHTIGVVDWNLNVLVHTIKDINGGGVTYEKCK